MRLAAFAALLVALAGALPAHAAAIALVMAVDVSGSVSEGRYKLQHDGIAQAFETPHLLDIIGNLPGGIEALVLEWSDPEKIEVTVGWTRITNRASAAAFAAAVRATKRTSSGLTAIGPALQAAGVAFDHMPEPAAQKIIDVSGDGMANFGTPPAVVRDELVKQGITINGLAILTEEPWLDEYYRHNVMGGPSSFVMVAKNYDSFADAMLRKLVQEVAAAPRRDEHAGGSRPGQEAISLALRRLSPGPAARESQKKDASGKPPGRPRAAHLLVREESQKNSRPPAAAVAAAAPPSTAG